MSRKPVPWFDPKWAERYAKLLEQIRKVEAMARARRKVRPEGKR